MSLPIVETARARMLAAIEALGPDEVEIGDADGRVLWGPVKATRSQPPFDASAMDGWAVRAADKARTLVIVGESAAGRGYEGRMEPETAVRIFTGAAVPAGADAVVLQEDARREGGTVLAPPCAPGQNIRTAGQDFRRGDALLEAGFRLDPWRLSLVAAAGLGRVSVARRPRVAILATGEELVAPGRDPGPFQIFNSGSTALAALVRSWGAEPIALTSAADSVEAIAEAVQRAQCDLLVTLGGASVGDYDLVKPALSARFGLSLLVDGVAVRPGKPTWFGLLADGRKVLGLPGNPASALVCAELFLRPILAAFEARASEPRLFRARCTTALSRNGEREHWMRASLAPEPDGVWHVRPFSDQDSSLVSVFAVAGALIRRPSGAAGVSCGELVEVLKLDRLD